MSANAPQKYDRVTLWLHAALATGVVIELALESVMHVPAGVGQGVQDWHREAFELHSHFGPTVAVICLLHWVWICLPFSRPGVAYLFPWLRREGRVGLHREFRDLLRLKWPPRERLSPLVGTVHGAGLVAVTGSVVGGTVSYLGYYTGVPIPRQVLHWAALELIVTSWFVWPFVISHMSMALWHRFSDVGTRVIRSSREEASYSLRHHCPGDIGWVVQRHGEIYWQEYHWDERFEALVADIAAHFVQNYDSECERCWIAERDGERLGCVFLVKESEVEARLRLLLVEPRARGMGLGKRLVEECIVFARSAGYKKITLWTNSVLDAARSIYRQHGFQMIRQENYRDFGKDHVTETWELEL